MVILFQPTQSYQYFKVRTAPLGCSQPLDIGIRLTNQETLVTSSYNPTTLFVDNWGFLNVEARMNLDDDTPYAIELVERSASYDCNVVYRGELFVTSGSATQSDSRPFTSYDGLEQKYVLW